MDKTPLAGKRILITRAREQSSVFSAQLKEVGAEVIEFPTIEIVPPLRWDDLDRAIDRLNSYHWIIFTSANGVHFFWSRLNRKVKKIRTPASLKFCAIGPATANQLKEKGISVDYMPKEYIAEAVLEGFEKMGIEGNRILLARAKKARDILPKGLKKLGAEVDVVEAYRTVKPRGGARRLRNLLMEDRIDSITFTSSSTVTHFTELLKNEDLGKRLKKIAIACIGPVTAQTARDLGMKVDIQPSQFTIPALTQAIVDYFTKGE